MSCMPKWNSSGFDQWVLGVLYLNLDSKMALYYFELPLCSHYLKHINSTQMTISCSLFRAQYTMQNSKIGTINNLDHHTAYCASTMPSIHYGDRCPRSKTQELSLLNNNSCVFVATALPSGVNGVIYNVYDMFQIYGPYMCECFVQVTSWWNNTPISVLPWGLEEGNSQDFWQLLKLSVRNPGCGSQPSDTKPRRFPAIILCMSNEPTGGRVTMVSFMLWGH